MLSVRNAIIAATVLFVSTLAMSLVSMVQEPDSGGIGKDTYGIRAYGFRGLFETLNELDVDVARSFSPPIASALSDETLVFLTPLQMISATEPTYLSDLKQWVHSGGRIVVAPTPKMSIAKAQVMTQIDKSQKTFLEAIGLDGVSVEGGRPIKRSSAVAERARNTDSIAGGIMEAFNVPLPNTLEVPVKTVGNFPSIDQHVRSITIPIDDFAYIKSEQPADGKLVRITVPKDDRVMAARFQRGKGEIIVLADARLISNYFIAKSDNCILAARLISPRNAAVRFDEFYHGLGVRGQPLYLLTLPAYASVAVGILIAMGLLIWRRAVFQGPPLPDEQVHRRDIREYVSAMARFFSIGKEGRSRLVSELRDGVIRQLSFETGVPPDSKDVDRIAAILERKQADRAKLLLSANESVLQTLQKNRNLSVSETLDAMQRMSACL